MWVSLSKQEKGSWLEESHTMHDWVVWCKSKKGAEEICSFELSGKEIFSNYDETNLKSKEGKNKKNGGKKKAHRGQSVRYRSWWKQDNIKMAVSEDHASCWVHKDLTVTTKQIQADTRQNGENVNPFGAIASVVGDQSGPWTGWIDPTPVEMSGCCLSAVLS